MSTALRMLKYLLVFWRACPEHCLKSIRCSSTPALQVACLMFFIELSGTARAGEITILAPPQDAIIFARDSATNLIVRLTDRDDIRRLRLETRGEVLEPFGTWQKEGAYFLHYRLSLKEGRNTFELNPWKKKVTLMYRPLRTLLNVDLSAPSVYLFHRHETVPAECVQCHDKGVYVDAGTHRTPYGFASRICYSCHKTMVLGSVWKHGPAADWLCLSCHQGTREADQIVILTGKVESLCFRCHVRGRVWRDMAHVHGPVSVGDCTVCHNPHGDRYPFALWADGQGPLCVACHTDKKRLLEATGSFFLHGILKGCGCGACHDPHAEMNRFQLYEPINRLCTGCHIGLEKLKKDHPVVGHPVEGPKDPRRKDRPFTCTSCHNPHASIYKHLLIGEALGDKMCTLCH